MIKQTILAATMVVAGLLGVAPEANARTNVYVGIGVPYGGYGGGCYGYGRYYCHPRYYYGGYPRYYAPPPVIYPPVVYPPIVYPRPVYPRPVYRMSCGQVSISLRNRGWIRLNVRDCGGQVYSFTGWYRGAPYLVSVSAYDGRVMSRRRL
jgi:hypothetical protein